ncbi:chemotaxis response regulator protein-glutamate methylesterase [Spirochaetota bacterium]
MSAPIKVLIVDDSSLVRKIVTDILQKDSMIEVVGTASNGKIALYKNKKLNPDVITMDIEMPILDGLAALEEIIKADPKPVIMMSVLTQHGAEATFKALRLGAVDFIPKPSTLLNVSVDDISELLIKKIKNVHDLKIKAPVRETIGKEAAGKDSIALKEVKKSYNENSVSPRIIGMGTSTGGPSALMDIFNTFPDNFPSPVLVVQHMPEGFTKLFSNRLDSISKLRVKEAEDNDDVLPGHAYLAPGDSHMLLEKKGGKYIIKVNKDKRVSGHRPSIDVLFNSIAANAGNDSVGVIMTGMGKDGADGIKNIKKKGGFTIAQNEETSVVYGMNRVAVEKGVIDEIVPLFNIIKKIVEYI